MKKTKKIIGYSEPSESVRVEYKSSWKVHIDTIEVDWERRIVKINGKEVVSPMSNEVIDKVIIKK